MRRRGLLTGLAATGLMAGAHAPLLAPWGVRQDVAALPQGRLAVLEAAIGEMQRRSRADARDPGGWFAHTQSHVIACATGEQQVHGTWWFLPWHRAFLAVTELKLQAISGDLSLRLPYWNWTSERRLPAAFTRPGSPLSQARRFTADRALRASEVDFPLDPRLAPLGVAALAARSFVPDATTGLSPQSVRASFGGMPQSDASGRRGHSRLEGVPHAAIHNYVGGEAEDGALGDMTELSTAALDPVFLAHHANLDRLWAIWQADPRHQATMPSTAAFTAKEFVFPWLDGTPLVVRVADILETARFGYGYDPPAALPGWAAPSDSPPPTAALAGTLVAPRLGRGQRAVLTITGTIPADRPMTLELTVAPQDDPAAAIVVGALAMGRRHGATPEADTEWAADVTLPLRRFGAGPVVVAAAPLALGPVYMAPPFPHDAMFITLSA